MRIQSTLICALPLLAGAHAAEQKPQQHPLGAVFEKISETVSPYLPPAVFDFFANFAPVEHAAARVAAQNVVPLNLQNWHAVLASGASTSKMEPEVWWVYVTGGNKTCFGMCDKADKAWNVSDSPEVRI